MIKCDSITVVIPTYGRDQELLDTIAGLLSGNTKAAEIVVVDQTPVHEPTVEKVLHRLKEDCKIRWILMKQPSIPRAMNEGIIQAKTDYILFVDDDIVPDKNLVAAHAATMADLHNAGVCCIAGQVLQPGETEVEQSEDKPRFFFNSNKRRFVSDVMAGNLCVDRRQAIAIGGFDENFVGVAYRFESDFARRMITSGGKIIFEPKASIRHLRVLGGGTRKYGNHLTSASPMHGVGDYYFALRQGISMKTILYIIRRPFREVRTKFHLRHPWWIPVKFVGELLAVIWALLLAARGPRYIESNIVGTSGNAVDRAGA